MYGPWFGHLATITDCKKIKLALKFLSAQKSSEA
jgi:hypothetical protein